MKKVNTMAEQSASDHQKYEVLFTKDQDMTKFLESFPQTWKEEQQKAENQQTEILSMLEDISKYVQQNMGGPGVERLGQV